MLRQRTNSSRKRYWRVSRRACTDHANATVIGRPQVTSAGVNDHRHTKHHQQPLSTDKEITMKIWNKPQVREQSVGMEVTAYLPADIDLI